ncbi:hypothetical protein Spith_0207 [Spirochaeta thermophila DSM 6578]|uniref:Uncharacterized protein n=1 Tax=Winmispira thermophila (strain ATCC 700085 / DSM 6578 / Z-1203) TaxID=869211 RepID=G0GCS5_WINT7|nr:DUF6657 family protein [Spirochaeta thermophila]AEJ60494.1 hypothetical protein Spith_0207 [Spirochaeta thermophila DSM 6578]
MGEIKSALEKALERAAAIEPDKGKLEEERWITKGKQSAARFLEDREFDIKKELKGLSAEQRSWFVKGSVETFLANLTLPSREEELERLPLVMEGLRKVLGEAPLFGMLEQQLSQFFSQYLATYRQVETALLQQFAPRFREKETLLSQQLGMPVKVAPESDPEYQAAFRQHIGQVRAQYEQHLSQVKAQIRKMLLA